MVDNSDTGTMSLSADEAADQLIEKMQVQSEAEEAEDQAIADDQEQAENVEEVEEVEDDDQTEDDDTDAAEEVEDEDAEELFYEIDGQEVSASQLKEWMEGGLRQSDYTKKTQELASTRNEVNAAKAKYDTELTALQSERTQLQNALAAFSIDVDPEPDWVQLAGQLKPEDFQKEQASWVQRNQQKAQAQQVYQALQQQQMQELQQREIAALAQQKPEWTDPATFSAAQSAMADAVKDFGLSAEEVGGLIDHRHLLVLNHLVEVKQELDRYKEAGAKVQKRVVKAQSRSKASGREGKNQDSSKKYKAKLAKAARAGDTDSLVNTFMAKLSNS